MGGCMSLVKLGLVHWSLKPGTVHTRLTMQILERDLLQCQLDSYYTFPNVHIPSEYLKFLFRVIKWV